MKKHGMPPVKTVFCESFRIRTAGANINYRKIIVRTSFMILPRGYIKVMDYLHDPSTSNNLLKLYQITEG
jgi:hypothetical protein